MKIEIEDRLEDAARRQQELKALKRTAAKLAALDKRLIEQSRALLAESFHSLQATERQIAADSEKASHQMKQLPPEG